MSFFKLGPIIRYRREELGYTQEDLADGICSVTTLSRIENGERIPTQSHLEILLQRIGYSDMMFGSYANENDFYLHDLKFRIRQAMIENNTETAKELLARFEKALSNPTQIDKQFLLFYKTLLYPERFPNEERLRQLEEAISLTHPKYKQTHVPHLLSYEEIILLNNIAICQAACGRRKEAIDILYSIVDYYDTHIVNIEEALRTEPLTLYNLSKMLGLENRYDECIDICEKGIQLAIKTGRSQLLGQTLYNKAWAYVKRGNSEDLPAAKELANKALHIADIYGKKTLVDHCTRFIQENQLL